MLTKPIQTFLDAHGSRAVLSWRYIRCFEYRSMGAGYALFARTGVRENGSVMERRLWHGDLYRARQLADGIEPVVAGTVAELEDLHDRLELQWAAGRR
jgi:hypothetical protein